MHTCERGCLLKKYMNFHLDAGCQGIEIYTCIKFHLQLHAHTCPIYNVVLEVGCCCFPRNDIVLNLTLFIGSQNFISPPSFTFVGAVVSEICELNQNKKKRILKLQFKTFPGHIIYPFFNQRYFLSTCMHSIC